MLRERVSDDGRVTLVRDCPLCGLEAGLSLTEDGTALVLRAHLAGLSPAVMCGATYFSPEDAQAVARIRDEGGDRLRLAAHP